MSLGLASIILAVISLGVSLFVAVRNWRYYETNVRYTSRGQAIGALFDLDRHLIDRPELWAIYDGHFMTASRSNDPEPRARRQAFLYYHFNLFETVYNDYNNVLTLTVDDRKYWKSWDKWIRDFFRESSEARSVFMETAAQGIFFSDFVTYVNGVIKEAELERRGEQTLAGSKTPGGTTTAFAPRRPLPGSTTGDGRER